MSGAVFRVEHRVIYSECTVGNHVYYSRYLEILEEARGEFFRQAGCPLLPLQQRGLVFPVIGLTVNYKAMARYDDVVTTELWITEQSGIRLTFAFRIVNAAGTLLVEGETRHICAGTDEKPKRLPPEISECLNPYLRATA